MSKLKMLLTVVMALGMTLGLAGMASAASIRLRSVPRHVFNNASTGSNGSKSFDARNLPSSDPRAVPGYENDLTPPYGNDRGLHGIHMNYSSASYGTQHSTGVNSSYVQRGYCGYCHANSHPNHESGFLQWSSLIRRLYRAVIW